MSDELESVGGFVFDYPLWVIADRDTFSVGDDGIILFGEKTQFWSNQTAADQMSLVVFTDTAWLADFREKNAIHDGSESVEVLTREDFVALLRLAYDGSLDYVQFDPRDIGKQAVGHLILDVLKFLGAEP